MTEGSRSIAAMRRGFMEAQQSRTGTLPFVFFILPVAH